MVFTSFLLGARHKRGSVGNKPASLLVVSLGKTLNGTPPSLCDRQVARPSSLPVVMAQSIWTLAKRANEKLIIWGASPKMKDLAHTKRMFRSVHDSKKRSETRLLTPSIWLAADCISSSQQAKDHFYPLKFFIHVSRHRWNPVSLCAVFISFHCRFTLDKSASCSLWSFFSSWPLSSWICSWVFRD